MQRGTEQLVLSDAVDRAVSQLGFGALEGRKVFLDTTYINTVKGIAFVNAPYIVSTLRQHITMAGATLVPSKDQAEVIVEARVGALGADGHDVSYGIPPTRMLNSAASLVPNAPNLPALPELSVAKRSDQVGIAKINAYAYDAKTGSPLWQSDTSLARSSARDLWLFGAGPFQSGSIYSNPMFVGREIRLDLLNDMRERAAQSAEESARRVAQFIAQSEEADESEADDSEDAPPAEPAADGSTEASSADSDAPPEGAASGTVSDTSAEAAQPQSSGDADSTPQKPPPSPAKPKN